MLKALLLTLLVCTQYNSFSNHAVPEFTAVFDGRKDAVLVRWQNKSTDTRSFIVQRSVDNNTWAEIAKEEMKPNSQNRSYYFEDKKTAVGESFYRLKCISVNGKTEFSQVVTVIIVSPANSWVMYPVPVTDLLTLEYRGNKTLKGVINVFIQRSSSGSILTKVRYSSLNKIIKIPVGNLGKGIYDVRIIVQGEIIWNQRFAK